MKSTAALSVLFVLLSIAGATAQEERPRLIPPDPDKLLLLDRRVVALVEEARLVHGKVVKEPANPLFQADKPWENSMNNLYPNLLWDEEEGIFKLWYKCVLADADVIESVAVDIAEAAHRDSGEAVALRWPVDAHGVGGVEVTERSA